MKEDKLLQNSRLLGALSHLTAAYRDLEDCLDAELSDLCSLSSGK